jgi:CRP/FNR family cyclic AMP-dependent transcriptional regulator
MSSLDPSDLSRVALFAGLDVPDQRVVATWLDVGEFEPGYKMTHEGASGYAFFVLHAGAADVVVGGNVVRTLGPGDFFGELSMLGDGRQTATVTVARPSTIWTMFGTRFRELQQQHPEIAAAIEKVAAERVSPQ